MRTFYSSFTKGCLSPYQAMNQVSEWGHGLLAVMLRGRAASGAEGEREKSVTIDLNPRSGIGVKKLPHVHRMTRTFSGILWGVILFTFFATTVVGQGDMNDEATLRLFFLINGDSPQRIDIVLSRSGETVTLMTTESGGFTLDGRAFESGETVTAGNGDRYTLTMDANGRWEAEYVRPVAGSGRVRIYPLESCSSQMIPRLSRNDENFSCWGQDVGNHEIPTVIGGLFAPGLSHAPDEPGGVKFEILGQYALCNGSRVYPTYNSGWFRGSERISWSESRYEGGVACAREMQFAGEKECDGRAFNMYTVIDFELDDSYFVSRASFVTDFVENKAGILDDFNKYRIGGACVPRGTPIE